MKIRFHVTTGLTLGALLLGGISTMQTVNAADSSKIADFYKIKIESIEGKTYSLAEYQGKVVLVVNTASACGYTPQYKGLENLYEKYKDKGLVVLGMPCNQFGNQEPGTEKEIKKFCELRFGVHFPLMKKNDVKGPHQHPLYQFLLDAAGPKEKVDVKWNFEKFLIGRDGHYIARFKSAITPESPELVKAIDQALDSK